MSGNLQYVSPLAGDLVRYLFQEHCLQIEFYKKENWGKWTLYNCCCWIDVCNRSHETSRFDYRRPDILAYFSLHLLASQMDCSHRLERFLAEFGGRWFVLSCLFGVMTVQWRFSTSQAFLVGLLSRMQAMSPLHLSFQNSSWQVLFEYFQLHLEPLAESNSTFDFYVDNLSIQKSIKLEYLRVTGSIAAFFAICMPVGVIFAMLCAPISVFLVSGPSEICHACYMSAFQWFVLLLYTYSPR